MRPIELTLSNRSSDVFAQLSSEEGKMAISPQTGEAFERCLRRLFPVDPVNVLTAIQFAGLFVRDPRVFSFIPLL
jgi:hypothetical protein